MAKLKTPTVRAKQSEFLTVKRIRKSLRLDTKKRYTAITPP